MKESKGKGKVKLIWGGQSSMRLHLFYREGRANSLHHLAQEDYKSKRDFKFDARRNGYRVVEILSDQQIVDIVNRGDLPVKEEIDLTMKYREEIIEYIEQVLEEEDYTPEFKEEEINTTKPGHWVTVRGKRVFIPEGETKGKII